MYWVLKFKNFKTLQIVLVVLAVKKYFGKIQILFKKKCWRWVEGELANRFFKRQLKKVIQAM